MGEVAQNSSMDGVGILWKHAAITVTGRTAVLRAMVKNSEGRPLCRWCGGLVLSPRRAWCTKACVQEYKAAIALVSSDGQRDYLFKLEAGVCRVCCVDAERLRRDMKRAYRLMMYFLEVPLKGRNTDKYRWQRGQAMCAIIGPMVHRRTGRDPGKLNLDRTWWEADHIVPLIEGGDHSEDNLRTLCIWCHRDETAALAKRRAGEAS